MVEQLGFAITPWCPRTASGLTSGTTSGTRGSRRQALVLSTTTAPCAAQAHAWAFETEPPADEKATSTPRSPSSGSASTVELAPA